MIADPTIHALIDLFKHLFRIRAIPFQWDSKSHVLRIPVGWGKIGMWYVNFASSLIFSIGFLFRFSTNLVGGNLTLAEFIICYYIVAVQVFYFVMMLNSYIYWEMIPLFINQWLLFNKNSTKISVRRIGKAAIGNEVMPLKYGPVEILDETADPKNNNNNETEDQHEEEEEDDSGIAILWKKLFRKVNEMESVPKTLEFQGPAKKFNIYLMILRTFFTKKLKVRDLFEPPVLISVLKNSVLSDAIFFAVLASRLDKMSLVPNKSFWFELTSGIWVAYQVYMTWNNVIFYLFVVILFSYDTNKWLKFCENNQLWMMTSGAIRRKFELNLRIHRILQILNNQFNGIYKIFITFGHKFIMCSYQTAALYGTLRLWGKVNKFSYIVFPTTVVATTSVEILAYRIFASNTIASRKFVQSWKWSSVLRSPQRRAVRSCRPLKLSMVAYATESSPEARERMLSQIQLLCSTQSEMFWQCMNETRGALEQGAVWGGRPCCSMAQTRPCQTSCLTAARSSDLVGSCRRSDETGLFHCLAKQELNENCCRQSKRAECVTACRNYLRETPQPNRRHGLRKRFNAQCDRDGSVLSCVANLTHGTPIQNPERSLGCCSLGQSSECQQACWRALRSLSSDLAVFETLEKDCGHPRPDDKMWQCFLQNAEPKRAELSSKIDRLGMDAAKLHCCHRAVGPSCRRLCHKTYSREWTGSWTDYNQMCLSNPKEHDLRDCVDEVEEPCELGCDGLNFCSAFNNRPSELFRRCNAAADMDAQQQFETWKSLGYIPFMDNMKLPLKDLAQCATEKWKAVACALQLRPCHPRNHASMICRADCNSLLHECINLEALSGHMNVKSICDYLSPPPGEPCVSLGNYVQQPKARALEQRNEVEPQITRPCKSHPCNASESCQVNRKCLGGKCEPYTCLPGCTLGEVSRMIVPANTWVRVPLEKQGCHRLCRCGEDGRMENCVPSVCEPHAPCWLGKNQFLHGTHFWLDCNLCSCRSGELICSTRQCQPEDDSSGFLFTSPSYRTEVALPCNCPAHRSPVCGSNGRTYPSSCLAKCGRLTDIDITPGECAAKDPCEGVSCGNGRRCIQSKRVCLLPLGKRCPQFQCVPLKCEESWHRSSEPVCDTSGRQHRNLCSLSTAGAMLAYMGPCLRFGCSPEGPICGIDGETYPSECAAEVRGIPKDYSGPCRLIGTGDGTRMEPSCGKLAKCPELPPNCIGVTPSGACCPICGGILRVIYSPHQVERLADETDSQLITVDDITARLNSLVQTAQCRAGAYLGLGNEIMVVVRPVGKSWTHVQLQACISEAERLAALITQQNPVIQVDASLSVLTAAVASHVSNDVPMLHSSLSVIAIAAVVVIRLYR